MGIRLTTTPEFEEASISTRIALVGGGASGIGHATAESLARAGHRVVITGRRAEALTAAATVLRDRTGAEVHPVVGDVADSGSAGSSFIR